MRLKEDNILVDHYTVDECISELSSIDNREEYYKSLVRDRLEKCNNIYVNEFNESIDDFINRVSAGDFNISKLSKLLKSISRFTYSLCELEIRLYDSMED